MAQWLAGHGMAPMGFLVQVDPLTLLEEHRVHLAEQDGRVVGFLTAAPIFARPGGLSRTSSAAGRANGTTELLVDHAMPGCGTGARGRDLADGDARARALAGQVVPALRLARSAGSVLFDFEGLRAFKARLRPTRWSPIHLVYPPTQGAVRTMLDVLEAFARGHLLTFGLRTLLRGPPVVVGLLAALLVPWTVLLALAEPWHFPAAWVRWAWVAFDVVLAAALFRLVLRWSDRLSRVVVAAVGADAAVTVERSSSGTSRAFGASRMRWSRWWRCPRPRWPSSSSGERACGDTLRPERGAGGRPPGRSGSAFPRASGWVRRRAPAAADAGVGHHVRGMTEGVGGVYQDRRPLDQLRHASPGGCGDHRPTHHHPHHAPLSVDHREALVAHVREPA